MVDPRHATDMVQMSWNESYDIDGLRDIRGGDLPMTSLMVEWLLQVIK